MNHNMMMNMTSHNMTNTTNIPTHSMPHGMTHPMDHNNDTTHPISHSELMQMFFTLGNKVTVVFKEWETSSDGEIIVSCLALLVIAFLYEGLKVSREMLMRPKRSSAVVMAPSDKMSSSFLSCRHFLQTLLHMIQVSLGYFLMLVVMTFNVWLCISIVVGAGLGYFAFGWLTPSINNLGEHCNW